MKKLYTVLYAIAMATTIYYNGTNNQLSKMLSMVVLGALFVLALFKDSNVKFKPKEFKTWVIWIVIACVMNFILGLFNGIPVTDTLFYFNLEIAMPLMVAYSSYYLLDIKRDRLSMYMLPVCAFSAYCAVSAVLNGLGGFVVAETYDVIVAKNQVGAAFTSVAIICLVFAMEDKRMILKLTYIVLSLFCLYPAIFFTCRSALIAYFIVAAFLLVRDYGAKSLFIIPLVLLAFALLGGEGARSLLYDSIVGNRDANDLDDLSSGRITHLTRSLEYFSRHPFLGELDGNSEPHPPTAHVFLVYRLTRWGLLGVIPFIALYWSVFKIFLRSIKKRYLLIAGLLCLAFVESFTEYSPPFGPGSCFIVMFILIGYFLRQETQIT